MKSRDSKFLILLKRAAGRKGGLAKVPKGFAANRDLARVAGRKGAEVSNRVQRERKGQYKEIVTIDDVIREQP